MPERVSKKRLEELSRILGDRDKAILNSIREYRYLYTDQLQRLHFTESANPAAALRAANRNLKKLREMDLIAPLDRRVGGIVSGSGSLIWKLEAAGEHFLRLLSDHAHPRRKHFEPSTYFLAHTLAVSECFVRITEICSGRSVKLTEVRNEPDNWRPYNSGGKIVLLKPDLFAVTVCGGYEDRWFFEIDLSTESPVRIIEKCRRYHKYYQSNLEQKQFGVFPLVVWIVPDAARKLNLTRHIQSEFAKLPNIFTVITPDELEALIRQGAGEGESP
ncbi:MAG: replication-relaxation family protein [Lachnospiraceae bacterium]